MTKEEKPENKAQLEQKHNLFQQSAGKDNRIECRDDESLTMARFLDDTELKFGFGQQHTLNKGLKKFGLEGVISAEKEIGQLHDRTHFKPVRITDMTHKPF